jgi:hypothetical protein
MSLTGWLDLGEDTRVEIEILGRTRWPGAQRDNSQEIWRIRLIDNNKEEA